MTKSVGSEAMKSNYIAASTKRTTRRKKPFAAIVSFVLSFVIVALGITASVGINTSEANADGPVDYLICSFFPSDSVEYQAYQAAYTDDFAYLLYSKSAVTSGLEDVTSGMNSLLNIFHDFKGVNETILGRSLDPAVDKKGTYNGGVKVNPYDRFGMAGLNWTSYSGEWNYQKVDICSSAQPVNMKIGQFYKDRLTPQSTWSNAPKSTDVRSKLAADKVAVLGSDWMNIVANGVFTATKGIVVVTNALIGVAFADLPSLIGLNDLLSNPNGIFGKLYQGVYLPLLAFVMLIMAVWAFWNGIVKRAYRRTLGGIAQSIGMFILAAVIALSPGFWISLPNNIAVIIQSILVNTMSAGLHSGDGLCSVGGTFTTDKDGHSVPAAKDSNGVINTNPGAPTDVTNAADAGNLLEQASHSMQSVIGCQIWYSYAFRPWVMGQYGTEFQNLWANGYADTSLYADSKQLGNDNALMVGNADVPLGGGYTIHNWAIFQLSTQTTVHAQYGEDHDKTPIFTDGVANDWWRVVDAVSNYNEKVVSNGVPAANECSTDTPVANAGCATDAGSSSVYNNPAISDSSMPDTSKPPTNYWESWNGTRSGERVIVALGSLLPAIFGNIAPIMFAGASAIFSLGISIAVAFAPIFLLLGCWPGTGFRIFKEWAQLLVNLMMKRVIAGILLVLSLVLISMILSMMGNQIAWPMGIIIIIIMSVALVKFREKIFGFVGGIFTFNFASGAFRDTSMAALEKTRRFAAVGKNAGTIASGFAAGSKSRQAGQSQFKGFMSGVGYDLKNRAYAGNELSRQFAMLYDKERDSADARVGLGEICAYCGNPIVEPGKTEGEVRAARDNDGNWVCEDCAQGRGIKGKEPITNGATRIDTYKVADQPYLDSLKGMSTLSENPSDDELAEEIARNKKRAHRINADLPLGDTSTMDGISGKINFRNGNTGEVASDIKSVFSKAFKDEINNFEDTGTVPAIPAELKPHLPPEAQKQVEVLWRDGSTEAKETIAFVYTEAIVKFSYESGVHVGDLSGEVEGSIRDDIQAVYGSILTEVANNKR